MNANKVLASSSNAKCQHLVKGRELSFIDSLTSDGEINRSAEGVGRFNQCMAMLDQPPTNKAFSSLNSTVLQAMDQRGASYTSRFRDMRAYHGTSAARQRGNNTGLITPAVVVANFTV